MKFIFLDFDGVINSIRSATAFGGYPWNVDEGCIKLFDPVAIALVNKLAHSTDSDIILSSTWRIGFKLGDLAQKLGIPFKDSTSIKLFATRGEEINWYLEDHPCDNYVILDDSDDMLEVQLEHFIQVDPVEGLSMDNIRNAYQILKGEALGKDFYKWGKMKEQGTCREFAKSNVVFIKACELAKVEPTIRQASKYMRHIGTACRFMNQAKEELSKEAV